MEIISVFSRTCKIQYQYSSNNYCKDIINRFCVTFFIMSVIFLISVATISGEPIIHHMMNSEIYSVSVWPGQCSNGLSSLQPCPPVYRKSASFHPPGSCVVKERQTQLTIVYNNIMSVHELGWCAILTRLQHLFYARLCLHCSHTIWV